jgi:hypothetical protein
VVHDPSRSFIAWAMVTINNVGKQPDEPQSPTIKGTIRSNVHNKTRNLYGQLTTIGFYKPQFMPPHEPHGSNSSLKPDAEGAGAQIFIPNDSRANYDTDGSFRAMGRLLFAADEGIFTYAGQAECTSGRSTIPRYREVRKAANFSSGLPKGRRSQSGRPAARRWPRGLWGIGLSIILCNRRKWTRSGCSRLVERHAE